MEIVVILIFMSLIACSFFQGKLCSDIADTKGHCESKYFWYGFFFGIIGLLIVIGINDLKAEKQRERIIFQLDELNKHARETKLELKNEKKLDETLPTI